MKPVSKINCLKHYIWGSNCDSWNLVDEDSLSVKLERMPANTMEALHFHAQAQQFFYILKGAAQFELDQAIIEVMAGEGLHIKAGQQHRIINNKEEDLEFLLCSQPSTKNDRVDDE
ncbi:MAG TPA: cupin domain-containing protein [Flavisolibacter sp.]|nr:cupin domain-containing protein [Flavisolibacter sp.]